MGDFRVEVGGIVVKPDEVLIIVVPEETTPMFGDELRKALNGVGLEDRSLVIRGDAKLATVPRHAV
jgi:hypothetical protein